MFQTLSRKNTHLPFFHVEESAFLPFGRLLSAYDFQEALTYLKDHTPIPETGNVYVASSPPLEAFAPFAEVAATLFGAMPMQVGYCNGKNSRLNGLEYHKASELLVAQTDLVLQLAHFQDLQNFVMDASKVKAFFVPKGTAVELFPTSLHLAPCKVSDEGFKAIIALPKGVNADLPENLSLQKKDAEAALLFKCGKWLLAHPENPVPLSKGAKAAITGPNLIIHY